MELAITDPLTGLHNRRYLDSHLGALFDEAASRGRPLSVLLLDIDRFKAINDTYGHDAGDEVLREFAGRVRASTRGIDLAGPLRRRGVRRRRCPTRPSTAPRPSPSASASAIESDAVPDPRAARGRSRSPSRSASRRREAGDTAAGEMLKRADLALYRAKQQGRNRVIAAAA